MIRRHPLLILIAVFMVAVSSVSRADSLRCHGDIIEPGDTEQQLLEACGEPTSREGSDWLYKKAGSVPLVVTIGNGVIMFIRDLDESDAGFGTHPFGDRP